MNSATVDATCSMISDPPWRLSVGWLNAQLADDVLSRLRAAIEWEQHSVRLFGRSVASPRLSCWIGDPEAVYTYSGTRFKPRPWVEPLSTLRERLQQHCAAPFNSVLANWYRNGSDSMGWHSDNEPELGSAPLIASLSLGANRRFTLRRKSDHSERRVLSLGHGDLLLMFGNAQRDWQHALPKSSRVQEDRINLTFRCIRADNRA
jgi:alkylated DNA repair dioxygenase AlkB